MSPSEFLAWQTHQSELYELVRGQPVPRAMTGATQRHDMVVVNAIAAFRAKLRGTPCRPSTDDVAVLVPNANIRRPDMTIDCGPIDPTSLQASSPTLVLEVLSPSTSEIDRLEKLEEYKTIPSIAYILIAEPGAARVLLFYARTEGRGWTSLSYIGLESALPLPALGCTLPLSELYEGVVPLSRPAS